MVEPGQIDVYAGDSSSGDLTKSFTVKRWSVSSYTVTAGRGHVPRPAARLRRARLRCVAVTAAPRHISADERRARLGVRHLLAPGTAAGDVPAVADALVALRSTGPATVYLSVAARLAEPSAGRRSRRPSTRTGASSAVTRYGARCGC